MIRKNLRLVVCGLLVCWGCGSSGQKPRPPGDDVAGTGGNGGDGGGAGGDAGAGGSGGSTRPDSGSPQSTGGAGGVDASAGGEGGTGGDAGNDAGQSDTSAGTPDAGGPDGAKTSCAGGAIAFNANVPTNHDPAMARVMVDYGNSPELPVGNSPRTVELWAYVKSTSRAGDANTIFEYGLVKPNQGFGLDFGGKRGSVDPYTNGSFDNDNQPTGLDPTKDQWVHFAMTYDGTAVVLYVNGVQAASKTSPGNMLMTARSPLTIGGNPRGSYFNGYLDEVRLWNVARSQAEIAGAMKKSLTGNEAGLVGYWKFDETSGTVAADSTTRPGHTKANGTLMAASAGQLPAWIPSTAPIECP